jgi:hypothetical protein
LPTFFIFFIRIRWFVFSVSAQSVIRVLVTALERTIKCLIRTKKNQCGGFVLGVWLGRTKKSALTAPNFNKKVFCVLIWRTKMIVFLEAKFYAKKMSVTHQIFNAPKFNENQSKTHQIDFVRCVLDIFSAFKQILKLYFFCCIFWCVLCIFEVRWSFFGASKPLSHLF